jgi:hypothetical protein
MSIPALNNLDSGLQARDIINALRGPVNSISGSVSGSGNGNTSFTGSFTGSLLGIATTASYTPNALITASVSSNIITFTKGNGTTFLITVNTGSGGGGATSPGGSDTQIQFNSGSTFSGSSNFTFDYINNVARVSGSLNVTGSTILSSSLRVMGTTILTGSLNVTGSTILSGSLTNIINDNATHVPTFINISNAVNASTALVVETGNGVSGSKFIINPSSKGNTFNPYYSGSVLLVAAPSDLVGAADRPIKLISLLAGTTATNNAFEWHHSTPYFVGVSTLKMKLDVPSGVLSNSGSIVTSGSLTIASGSLNTINDSAMYFGSSGSVGSWRIAPSGSNLVIQKWNGTLYTQSGIFS